MALLFDAQDEYVNHQNGASINNLDTQTWIFVLFPTQDDQVNRRLVRKAQLDISMGNTGGLDGTFIYFRARATTNTGCRTAVDTFAAGSWQFVAFVDEDGVAPQIWHGVYPAKAAETGYETQTTGVDGPTDESGVDLAIGARPGAPNRSAGARIAMVWVYDVRLTEAQILAHQYAPSLMYPGCVLKSIYGYNGTGTQADWSGNGNNGTVIGGSVADHAPLGPPFGFDASTGLMLPLLWAGREKQSRRDVLKRGLLTAVGF